MVVLPIILTFLGICAFLIPGILLSFIIFTKADSVQRTTYSLALSTGIFGVMAILLYYLNIYSPAFIYSGAVLLMLIFSVIILAKKKKNGYETTYDKSTIFIFALALFGTLWRYFCIKYFQMSSYGLNLAYNYSFKFVGEKVPDLGFYTGMAQDKAKYIGTFIGSYIFDYLHINYETAVFFFVFMFLGFIFLVFKEYRVDKRLAYLGVAVMSIGPIELFYNNGLYGHTLSYVLLLPFFLMFKPGNKKIFWIILLFSITMIQTYYTSSAIIILSSLGFALALVIKELLNTRKIRAAAANLARDKRIFSFLGIFLLTLVYLSLFSGMFRFSLGRLQDNSDIKIETARLNQISGSGSNAVNQINETSSDTLYRDPSFLGLSAIRWQMLFFFLSGLTLIFYLINLKIKSKSWPEEATDIFLCLIPVIAVSYGFWHVNLPARIFDYFAFFGLMSFIPLKKHFNLVFILSLAFILTTGIYVAKDKKVFFEISEGEVTAAIDIKEKLDGVIFSDQVFINQLVMDEYYSVTGANDKDKIVKELFYQNNRQIFLSSVRRLKDLNIPYIAITQRMREKYVLMLNYPQKAIFNYSLYEENLKKIYDNGDVKVYSTNVEIVEIARSR